MIAFPWLIGGHRGGEPKRLWVESRREVDCEDGKAGYN